MAKIVCSTSVGLPRVLEYSSSTRVVSYSSNFLLLEYSLISISGCKFPFPVAVLCSHGTNCCNLCKLEASRFHLQHASLEINVNIYMEGVLRSQQRGYSLKPVHSGTVPSMRRQLFWATVYKTVCSMLSDHCPVCLSVLSVCNLGVLWLNGWFLMDQDETWHGGRPVSRPHALC